MSSTPTEASIGKPSAIWSVLSTIDLSAHHERQVFPNVCVYTDNILVTGETDQEHLKTLDEVLTRLLKAGLRLKQMKCAFMQPSIEYLGHNISG